MCGILGYTGSEDVKGVLLDALELLEYRGYELHDGSDYDGPYDLMRLGKVDREGVEMILSRIISWVACGAGFVIPSLEISLKSQIVLII